MKSIINYLLELQEDDRKLDTISAKEQPPVPHGNTPGIPKGFVANPERQDCILKCTKIKNENQRRKCLKKCG